MAGLAWAGSVLAFGRLDYNEFHTGSSMSTSKVNQEEVIKAVADLGIDVFLARFSREGVDLCSKYGLKAVVRDIASPEWPYWWGGSGKPGEMAKKLPLAEYERLLVRMRQKFGDHPAIVAFEFTDEPSALDFEHVGRVAALFNTCTGNYINLFPSYASSGENSKSAALSQLGAKSYEEYLELYCKYVPNDVICFDNYMYGWGHMRVEADLLLENLRIAADACLGTRRSLIVEVQAKTYCNKSKTVFGPEMTENRLRYQCNAALAFGARQIDWINLQSGWWTGHIFDGDGKLVNRPLYDRLKRVNGELRRQGNVLVRYERTHTDFVDFDRTTNGLWRVKQLAIPQSSGAAFVGVRATDQKPLLVGHFVSRTADGTYVACVMAADDPTDSGETVREVRFQTFRQGIEAIGPDGPVELKKVGEHEYAFEIRSNRAIILRTR